MATRTLILTALVDAEPATLQAGDHTRSAEVGQGTRSYFVHVPPGYCGSKLIPAILGFNGGGRKAQQMVRFCGQNDKSDKEGSSSSA